STRSIAAWGSSRTGFRSFSSTSGSRKSRPPRSPRRSAGGRRNRPGIASWPGWRSRAGPRSLRGPWGRRAPGCTPRGGRCGAVAPGRDAGAVAIRDVRQVRELGQRLGAPVAPASTDEVQEFLTSVRETVRQAERAVDDVREFATPGGGEPLGDRLARVTK